MSRIIDLDRAAAAYDQRSVPIALGRTFLVFGAVMAGVSVVPPSKPDWAVMGLLVAGVGLLIVLAFRHPASAAVRKVAGVASFALGVVFVASAVLGMTPDSRIVPFDQMNDRFVAALAVANRHYDSTGWLVARLVTSLLEAGIGIGFVLAGYCFLRVGSADSYLLRERSGSVGARTLSFLLDVPPGLVRYLRVAYLPMGMAVVAMLLFSTATTNLAGARMIHGVDAISSIGNCIDEAVPMAACFDAAGRRAAVGMLTLAATSVGVLPLLGSVAMNSARRRAALSAATRLAADDRAPLLFLRSFRDDQVTLQPPKGAIIRFPFAGLPSLRTLDHILVERFLTVGPIVALMSPEERAPPFGAVRRRLDHADWQREVERLAHSARRIVFVFDETVLIGEKGISWEIAFIGQDPELRGKTVFVIHPDKARNQALWHSVGERIGLSLPDTTKPMLSCNVAAGGAITATTASRFDATTVLLALRSSLES